MLVLISMLLYRHILINFKYGSFIVITYEKDNNVALITLIHENGYIVDVFSSFEGFLSGESPIHTFNVANAINDEYISNTLLPGWQKIYRDDQTWEKLENNL